MVLSSFFILTVTDMKTRKWSFLLEDYLTLSKKLCVCVCARAFVCVCVSLWVKGCSLLVVVYSCERVVCSNLMS